MRTQDIWYSAPETRGRCPRAGKGLGSLLSGGGAGDIWPAARPTCWGSAWPLSCAGSISVWRDPATGRSVWPARRSSATPPAPGTPCSQCSASPICNIPSLSQRTNLTEHHHLLLIGPDRSVHGSCRVWSASSLRTTLVFLM